MQIKNLEHVERNFSNLIFPISVVGKTILKLKNQPENKYSRQQKKENDQIQFGRNWKYKRTFHCCNSVPPILGKAKAAVKIGFE